MAKLDIRSEIVPRPMEGRGPRKIEEEEVPQEVGETMVDEEEEPGRKEECSVTCQEDKDRRHSPVLESKGIQLTTSNPLTRVVNRNNHHNSNSSSSSRRVFSELHFPAKQGRWCSEQ